MKMDKGKGNALQPFANAVTPVAGGQMPKGTDTPTVATGEGSKGGTGSVPEELPKTIADLTNFLG